MKDKSKKKEVDTTHYVSIKLDDIEYWSRVKIEAIRRRQSIGSLVVEALRKFGIE